jgi:transposase InsO family protein
VAGRYAAGGRAAGYSAIVQAYPALADECANQLQARHGAECTHGERFGTRAQMRQTVFEYIESDYNRQRRHSTLGYISPEAFEARMSA